MLSEIRTKLLSTLRDIHGIDDFKVRTFLLTGLDKEGLERHKANTRIDLAYIVNRVMETEEVSVLIKNAKYLAESQKKIVRRLEAIDQDWNNLVGRPLNSEFPQPPSSPVSKQQDEISPKFDSDSIKTFDVFLAHNSQDKPQVETIAYKLKQRGLKPWFDKWELRPGLPWQKALEEQIENINAAAVFIGPNGIGPWENIEVNAFLRQFVKRGCPVIPVLLPDCEREPKLPLFLEEMMWVDFRKEDPDPLEQLHWGITGKRS